MATENSNRLMTNYCVCVSDLQSEVKSRECIGDH
jgi:hypothetical protein